MFEGDSFTSSVRESVREASAGVRKVGRRRASVGGLRESGGDRGERERRERGCETEDEKVRAQREGKRVETESRVEKRGDEEGDV